MGLEGQTESILRILIEISERFMNFKETRPPNAKRSTLVVSFFAYKYAPPDVYYVCAKKNIVKDCPRPYSSIQIAREVHLPQNTFVGTFDSSPT